MIKKITSLYILLCLTLVVAQAQVQQTWQNLTGIQNTSGALSKTTAAGWNGAGARSRNTLFANTDGWFEFTIDNNATTANYMVGFSSINNVYTQTAIDFGVEVSSSDGLKILSHQSSVTGTLLGSVVVGDVIRVSRVGSAIKYFINSVEIGSVPCDAGMYYVPKVIVNYGVVNVLTTSFSPLAETGEIPNALEQSVLQDMYASLGGSGWTNSPYWPMTGTLPVNSISSYGVTMQNGDIYVIFLAPTNLSGTLPASIGYLSKMTQLNLSGNIGLTGSIPTTMGNLSSLQYMYLNSCSFTGPIPSSLGNLSNLLTLNLGYNQLSGTIPTELNALKSLTYLGLGVNKLTGDIPDLSGLTNLNTFGLSYNPTLNAGSIPTWIQNLKKLGGLYLTSTNRTGSIPVELSTLPVLSIIDFSSNQLTGSIPDIFGGLLQLTSLNLSVNQLSGSIPSSICSSIKLQTLDLFSNQLTGSIPANIGDLTKMIQMRLYSNQLSGSIPASVYKMTLLVTFNLSANKLSGQIPSGLDKATLLQTLDLHTNQLSGSIPPTFSNLINLTTLNLADNQLSGSIPSSLGNFPKLIYFYLHLNQLTGEIPESISGLKAIQQIAINNNKLTGSLPQAISTLSTLVTLGVNNNNLTGSIPEVFGSLTKLNSLNISNNQFTGAFPSSIGGCGAMITLDARVNQLTSVPASILTLPKATGIYFSDNEITSIPDFSQHVNKANLQVYLQNLRLDFAQLEPLVGAGIKSLIYTPYKDIKDVTAVNIKLSNPFTLTSRPAGSFSTVYWEKQNTNGTWTVLTNDQDAVATTYTRTGATTADEGVYRWRMTNTKVGGTIQSVGIVVKTSGRFALDTWAFQYKYDARKRMIAKKVPGADWVYMVYDNRDRLVLTQDGNQRSGTTQYWTFTKYDELNRPILTGIKDTTAGVTQAGMQSAVDTYYSNLAVQTWRKYGETYKGTAAANTVHGYSNCSYPKTTSVSTRDENRYLTVTYYDSYDFRNDWRGTYTYYNDALHAVSLTGTYDQDVKENSNVIGQVTGTKIKVLDGGVTGGYTWLKTINYYDPKYRVIQTQTDNYKGGKDQVSNLYDFVGKVLTTKETHIEYDPTLTGVNNVNLVGNKLVSMSNAWGNSGAASIQTLAANQDGWVECIASETTTGRIFGLSDTNPDYGYASIRYGYQQSPTGLYAIESNVQTQLTTSYNPGDILTLERVGSTINYKRNGTVIKTTTGALTSTLFVDIAMNHLSGTLVGLRSSFSTTSHSITRRFIYDHAGRLLETWHQIDTQPDVRIAYNEYNELGQLTDKKLHSTSADASDNKQSVDYRYNIRGWLTSINDSQLGNGDLFGMNLVYESNDTNLGSTGLFNGNISGMKWSVGTGQADTKELGYNFSYDAMNRLKDANSRVNNASGWGAGNYDENGLSYDLNGNIKTLNRKGDGGVQIDNLTYNYGTSGNQLQYVQDNAGVADKLKGFADGNINQNIDYTYDVNGNMTRDLNKAIGSSTTDNTSLITYNYLNLPEKVVSTLSNGSVQYVYDATGRKLSQAVTGSTGTFKYTDYSGEFTYEQDVLKYINHEEGRIVMQKQELVILNDGSTLTGTIANWATTSLTTINGESYINVSYTGTNQRPAIGMTGNSGIGAKAGERYLIRAKGFRNGTTPVSFIVRVNGSIDLGSSTSLPYKSMAEGWIEKVVTIPSDGPLAVSVGWNPTATGESFSLNDFQISKLSTITPEYQYNLKDHLGNVRVTFTSTPETVSDIATLESSNLSNETNKFLRRDRVRVVNNILFDHTNDATATNGGAIRLSGSANEKTGLVKSIAVMPGDVVNMEVWAKYIDSNTTNWTGTLTTLLMNSIAAGTSSTVADGNNYPNNGSTPFPYTGLDGTGNSTGVGPKAYLNYIMFDKDFNPITTDPSQTNYVRLSDYPKEHGQNIDHEKLSASVTVKQAGYMYIYLSNEEATPVEVYFDDFKVTQVKSPVIQSQDYYPFGLTFNSYSRESSVKQDHLYNGKEMQDELNLGWLDYGARMYMSDIGRWGVPDILSEIAFSLSPYRYCYNNPFNYTDPFGLWEQDANGNYSTTDKKDIERFTSYLQAENVVQKKPADIDQIKEFIGEEKSGGLGKLSDGSQLVSEISVKGYSSSSHIDWYVNKTEAENAWHDVQGSLTPDALDPRTLGHNLFWLNYPGGNNPKTYAGDDDYSFRPGITEVPAYLHDKEYDALGVKGFDGLYNDQRALGADFRFVSRELMIAMSPLVSSKEQFQAGALGIGLGLIATPKAIKSIIPRRGEIYEGINPTRYFE